MLYLKTLTLDKQVLFYTNTKKNSFLFNKNLFNLHIVVNINLISP